MVVNRRLSFLLSVVAFTVLGSGLSARAEKIDTGSMDASAQLSISEVSAKAENTQSNLQEVLVANQLNPAHLEDNTKSEQLKQTTPTQEAANTTAPVPGTTATEAATLTQAQSQSYPTAPATEAADSEVAQVDVDPGTPTQGGSSYVGIAGNLGLGGDSALGDTSFAFISKIGLTDRISVRPSVMIESDPVIVLPATFDFSFNPVDAFEAPLPIAPYVGAGVAIETSDDADVAPLLTAGVDFPITAQLTATAAVNAAFFDDADVGVLVGVGYNFGGLF